METFTVNGSYFNPFGICILRRVLPIVFNFKSYSLFWNDNVLYDRPVNGLYS